MADSSKDIQLRELKDMINDLKKMIKTLQATVDAANKREVIIPGLFEPPVRTLRATIPENESHIFR